LTTAPAVAMIVAVPETTVSVPTRVLVMGMAHEDGTILVREVFPVAEACGQNTEQVRSCLRRLVSERLFVRVRSGRDAEFRATDAGLEALTATVERTRKAYAQDAAGRGWDGQWRLVAVAVPERRRTARDAFRDRLRSLGGALVQGGLYVSPHNWHADVIEAARRLGITDGLTLATTPDLVVRGERDPRELARQLWPVEELAKRYQRFVDRYSAVPDFLAEMRQRHERLSDAEFLPGALAVTVAFQACFNDDPLLPPELVPRPWPGRAARELLGRSRRLGLQLREGGPRPALFRWFDEALEAMP
jgi:phenylacetic acid degradation operon negative regulatory protein